MTLFVVLSSPTFQIKLKASTPNKQRLGHTDNRVLAIALDKENR